MFLPLSWSNRSSILGSGKVSLRDTALSRLQKRNAPSFFLTRTTGLVYGLADSWITSPFNISWTILVISSHKTKGTHRGIWRIGWLSELSITYSTPLASPLSPSSNAKAARNSTAQSISSWAWDYTGVSATLMPTFFFAVHQILNGWHKYSLHKHSSVVKPACLPQTLHTKYLPSLTMLPHSQWQHSVVTQLFQ